MKWLALAQPETQVCQLGKINTSFVRHLFQQLPFNHSFGGSSVQILGYADREDCDSDYPLLSRWARKGLARAVHKLYALLDLHLLFNKWPASL